MDTNKIVNSIIKNAGGFTVLGGGKSKLYYWWEGNDAIFDIEVRYGGDIRAKYLFDASKKVDLLVDEVLAYVRNMKSVNKDYQEAMVSAPAIDELVITGWVKVMDVSEDQKAHVAAVAFDLGF